MEKNKLRKEMFKAIEAWQSSGLSQKDFLAQIGVKQSKFQYWLKQYREQQLDTFIEIPTGYSQAIIIRYPDGMEVSLPLHTPLRFIKELVNFYSGV